ncbi:MAG: hypothetical protein IJT44_09690 [Clostridia bacterium]|nr:hypothetical protein [Clostridia bacterium]
MSFILSLTSVAIVAAFTVSNSALVSLLDCTDEENESAIEKGLDTMFVDQELLVKTLQGFDCHMQCAENEIRVETSCGVLRYARSSAAENFKMYVDEIHDVDALIRNIRAFEVDYGRNVQSYTYDHIRQNLADNMTIADMEVQDDDCLYLTINLE